MSTKYNAEDIEVLSGLDPVKKRPGMYTDTSRPNHLGQEVIDNSVDEAIIGFATKIRVVLYKDGSLEVEDDGRGMPVDIHPEEKVSGVELILTRLHAGGKFSNKNYQFSGGLHGVGVSVVNALSSKLEVEIKREGNIYKMGFANGDKTKELKVVGSVGKRTTGTKVHFWPNAKYFDSVKFSIPRLKHILKAKAVLCPGLETSFLDESTGEEDVWHYQNGLGGYLADNYAGIECLPKESFVGSMQGNTEVVDWAVYWVPEGAELFTESYVNLIPTPQGGTHVNGLRAGLFDAMTHFCELRNLLPRGIKLIADDLWEPCQYVLSIKMKDPQFVGQTKERLSSKQSAALVNNVTKDAFSIWLNENRDQGEALAQLIIDRAQQRLKQSKQVARKRVHQGPALPGKLADCLQQDLNQT